MDKFLEMAEALELSTDYRVLRRVRPFEIKRRRRLGAERVVILLDTETTGLSHERDEVIEIGMLAFTYTSEGRIVEAIAAYEGKQQPTVELSEDVRKITGLSDADLAGAQIDQKKVDALLDIADLLVAHNASFDRPMCEKLNSRFREKAWACSATEIQWRQLGYESSKLKYLLLESGYFYDAHRALNDCHALGLLLSLELGEGTAFNHLLQHARHPTFRIAARAGYGERMIFRNRGYRWKPGFEGRAGYWELDVSRAGLDQELAQLLGDFGPDRKPIYSVKRLTAFNRYQLQQKQHSIGDD